MPSELAAPAELIDVRPLGERLAVEATKKLAKTAFAELIRLVLPAGKEIKEHTAPGQLIVQCLEGRVEFTTMGSTKVLEAGQLLYLAPREPHALRAVLNSSLLLTIITTAAQSDLVST
ncbi:MAG: cupin domain-containing protein [Pirellulaceae bacterium]|nr:cupin domain-containing protein [Planctomycetales bacterium]